MRTRHWLYTLALPVAAAVALSGCAAQPQAQAQQDTTTEEILPTPPPMPTGEPQLPTPTPEAAPASAPLAAGSSSLLQANFDDAKSTSAWTVIDGADALRAPSVWQAENGRLAQVSDGDGLPGMYGTAFVTGDASWTDYQVSAAAYATGNEEMGVVARANDNGYYVLRVLSTPSSAAKYVLSRYDAQNVEYTTIATADGAGYELGQWYQLSLRVSGDRLEAFVNGQPVLNATDATLTSGRAGVYGYAEGDLQFDNFAVQTVAAQ